jgi:effector-binding domain-containing protein
MPSKYTLETLPTPNNSDVTLKPMSTKKVAVLRYTGYTPEAKVESKKAELLKYLERDNKEIVSDISSAQYNPPLSFPFVRRNEIIVEIK